VLNAANLLWRKNPSLKIIIVPRHPERFDSVAKLIEATGLPFVRSSQEQSVPENTNVILLDEMGKLNDAYAVGAFAFVGGSIADKGGHNALEPASFSIPIMMGPNTYNNPVICSHLEECGALVKIDSGEEMFTIVDKWICEPNERKKAGQAGRKVLEDNSGALESTVQCIRKYVN